MCAWAEIWLLTQIAGKSGRMNFRSKAKPILKVNYSSVSSSITMRSPFNLLILGTMGHAKQLLFSCQLDIGE